MDCKTAADLLVAYARCELSAEQTAQLEKHLAECPACRWNAEAARKTVQLLTQAAEPDTVALATDLVTEAVKAGASDLHVIPQRDWVEVSLRVDGVLRPVRRLPRASHSALVGRFLTLSELNPFEYRRAQFSRLQVRIDDHDYHLRVTLLPTAWGPALSLRLLPEPLELGLEGLGFSPANRDLMLKLLRQPCGLVVVSGPAGSGKTTTLYACLHELANPSISLLTVEESVAYMLEGVRQIIVDYTAGFDHATALRAAMQSDPDVIMVDFLRDQATATEAINLALSGHLVLAGLHAQDAPSAVQRLLSLGLDPTLVADSLIATTCQRLVRRICTGCRRERPSSAADQAFLREQGVSDIPKVLPGGSGCEACRGTGYRGRTTIAEILPMTPELIGAIADGGYTAEIGAAAMSQTMAQDGAQKALEAVTTVAEVSRVTRSPYRVG